MRRALTPQNRPSPVRAITDGLLAGAVGTLAMDLVWFRRYRRGGGTNSFHTWEFSAEIESWENAPAPALVGKRLVEGLFQTQISARYVGLVNNITHWGYGMFAGAQYGIIASSLDRPRIRYGPPFGAAVWATSYVVLPAVKLYKPIWEYDLPTLAKDLSAHLVFGLATGTAFQLLAARGY